MVQLVWKAIGFPPPEMVGFNGEFTTYLISTGPWIALARIVGWMVSDYEDFTGVESHWFPQNDSLS